MAQMNISSTLHNDTSEGVIAFAEQLRQQLINWNEYPHVLGELGQDRPNLQNDLNALFLSVYEKFLTFLNDADATSSAINTWKEIERFLADYADTGTLKEIVDQLNANIESRLNVVLENSTGSSTTNGMSQKAITDALGAKQDVIQDLSNIRSGVAKVGYYECPTQGSSAAKAISADNYVLSAGGSMKVKMVNANTADNATLDINNTGAKSLYYAGERASANNSWGAGETVEIYYDGTSYYANSVASGSGDGAFDISAKTGQNYETLNDALTAANSVIPTSKKKGGMSIKFIKPILATYSVEVEYDVTEIPSLSTSIDKSLIPAPGIYNSKDLENIPNLPSVLNTYKIYYAAAATPSDNPAIRDSYIVMTVKKLTNESGEYLQYRLMSTTFNTTPSNWQGVDDVPTVGSSNLVTSGGVASELDNITTNLSALSQEVGGFEFISEFVIQSTGEHPSTSDRINLNTPIIGGTYKFLVGSGTTGNTGLIAVYATYKDTMTNTLIGNVGIDEETELTLTGNIVSIGIYMRAAVNLHTGVMPITISNTDCLKNDIKKLSDAVDSEIEVLSAEIDELVPDVKKSKVFLQGGETALPVDGFKFGYYNMSGKSVGSTIEATMTTSQDLKTDIIDIEEGRVITCNTNLTVSSAVKHALIDKDGVIVSFPSTDALNSGFIMSSAEVVAGGCMLVIVYRISTQTDAISLSRSDTVGFIEKEIGQMQDDIAKSNLFLADSEKKLSDSIWNEGYYNMQGKDVGSTMEGTMTISQVLYTAVLDISQGKTITCNTKLSTTNTVRHALVDKSNKIVYFPSTSELNAGFTLTSAQITAGACKLVIVYRTTTQDVPISTSEFFSYGCLVKEIEKAEGECVCMKKTMILCGDSQLGQAQGVDSLIQDIVGGTVLNCGFGGCMMAWRSNDGSNDYDAFSMVNIADCLVSGDFTSMTSKTSIIDTYPYFATAIGNLQSVAMGDGAGIVLSIAYGGNDFASNISIGSVDTEIKTTFLGALAYAVRVLLSRYPRLVILLVGIPYRVYEYTTEGSVKIITSDSDDYTNAGGLHRYDYNDAILDGGKVLKIPAFDMYRRSGRNKFNVFGLCPDGTHPTSAAGKQAEAELYAKILQTF